jgi:CheY-like chemotaxis protein
VAEDKPKLLIVEDDLDVADMLDAYFRVQGYEVYTENWGEDGFATCVNVRPDLVILDIRLPDIDGYEVARRIRSQRRTESIPIIFLTEKRGRVDRLLGLELGADDYITKPFDVQELRLRIRNSLKRLTQGSITNPVTSLPEGAVVDEQLSACVNNDGWVVLLVSLLNLDSFRESYGFLTSDDTVRAVSLMVKNTVRKLGNPTDFVGHFDHTDFIVITQSNVRESLEERIRFRLEQSLEYFYPLKDREANISPGNRLALQIKSVVPEDGPFSDIVSLKNAVMLLQG